ncbi:MAG: hypothetical protein M3P30_05450 [Chloroflexota bacterium]|nr:hypothetical protein [Chloroflexota bacterium]
MLVLNKHAALDRLITRALRQSEVVPEPFAANAAAQPEFEAFGFEWPISPFRDGSAFEPQPTAASLPDALRYTAAASGSGAVR